MTTFVDTAVKHGGQVSLRMESIHKNQYRHSRIMQTVKLQPYRQYHVSVWIKTEGMQPADPEIKLLKTKGEGGISFQTFRTERTQDWKRVDIVFNSMDNSEGNLYLGSWYGFYCGGCPHQTACKTWHVAKTRTHIGMAA